MGIEPTQPAWKAGILAIELHPHFFRQIDTLHQLTLSIIAEDIIFVNTFFKFFSKYFPASVHRIFSAFFAILFTASVSFSSSDIFEKYPNPTRMAPSFSVPIVL